MFECELECCSSVYVQCAHVCLNSVDSLRPAQTQTHFQLSHLMDDSVFFLAAMSLMRAARLRLPEGFHSCQCRKTRANECDPSCFSKLNPSHITTSHITHSCSHSCSRTHEGQVAAQQHVKHLQQEHEEEELQRRQHDGCGFAMHDTRERW